MVLFCFTYYSKKQGV